SFDAGARQQHRHGDDDQRDADEMTRDVAAVTVVGRILGQMVDQALHAILLPRVERCVVMVIVCDAHANAYHGAAGTLKAAAAKGQCSRKSTPAGKSRAAGAQPGSGTLKTWRR